MIFVSRAVEVMLAASQFISFSSTARPTPTVFLHIIKLQLKDFWTVSNPVCCPFWLLFRRPQKVF